MVRWLPQTINEMKVTFEGCLKESVSGLLRIEIFLFSLKSTVNSIDRNGVTIRKNE